MKLNLLRESLSVVRVQWVITEQGVRIACLGSLWTRILVTIPSLSVIPAFNRGLAEEYRLCLPE